MTRAISLLFIFSISGCANSTLEQLSTTQAATATTHSTAIPQSTIDTSHLSPITAKAASIKMGTGFNLGQMFENTQHPTTFEAAKAKIDAYYQLGYRNVRIPITWTEKVGGDLLVLDSDTGEINTAHPRLQEIQKVVAYALSLPDLYVVINAHHEKHLKTENKWYVLKQLWRDIATLFSQSDHRLLFEILNEPHLDDGNSSAMPPENLRFMTSQAYAEIREIDPYRIIIIGGNQWFAANEMAKTWPNLDAVGKGEDAYLMATFHHYNPWTFNGDNQGDYADPWTMNDMQSPMAEMQDWANTVGNGMPVYIGEWGSGWESRYQEFDCNNIRYWYQNLDAVYAKKYQMPTAVWDDGGWFKIFDHQSNNFNNNLYQCIIDGDCQWQGDERFNKACY